MNVRRKKISRYGEHALFHAEMQSLDLLIDCVHEHLDSFIFKCQLMRLPHCHRNGFAIRGRDRESISFSVGLCIGRRICIADRRNFVPIIAAKT